MTTGGEAAATAVDETRAAPTEPRRTIGRYNLVRQLGAGGMGVVWEAIDPALGRRVAIKLLHGEGTAHHAERLRREAQALGQLHHPHVVSVFDVGVDDGDVYLVMQLIAGTTLDRVLARTKLTRGEIVALIAQAGRGLAAAHSAGIVHRDFKPSNVLVDDEGTVHVSDFGLARLSEASEEMPSGALAVTLDESITRDGIAGTPAYMAPEQLRRGPITPAADQFSFCVTLWEAIAGERPYAGADVVALREAILGGKRRELPSGVSRRIRGVLLRGLAIDPADRFASMEDLLDELEPRRRGLWIASGIGVAAAAAAGMWVATATGSAPEPCAGIDGSLLAGKWDATVADKLRAAFVKTGLRAADESSRRVIATLDGYARAWVDQRVAACKATHVRGDQSTALLDLRIACLDHRAGELGALAAALGEITTSAAIDKGVAASHNLTPLAACADREALLSVVPPPADPAGRASVARTTEQVYRAQSMGETGAVAPALALAKRTTEEARTVGYAPLVGDALRALAALEMLGGDAAAALRDLHEAAQASARGKDDHGIAKTWLQLARIYQRTRKLDEAAALEPILRAAVARAGDDRLLLVQLEMTLGIIERERGQLATAERRMRAALDAAPPDTAKRAAMLQSYATVLKYSGKYEEARTAYVEAIAIAERHDGPKSRNVITGLYNLARAELALERCDDALRASQREIALSLEVLGPDNPDQILDYVTLGDIHALCRRQLDPAREHYECAIRIAEAHPELGMVPTTTGSYGFALARREHPGEAVPLLERTLALLAKTNDPAQTAMYSVSLGEALLELARPADALAKFQSATTIYEKLDVKIELAWALHGTGVALIALRRPGDAIAPLERAAKLVETGQLDHMLPQRFQLARALWESGRDRTRAVALAREVAATYAKADASKHVKNRREVDAWLVAHGGAR